MQLTEYKVINEKHLTIGEDLVNKVLKALNQPLVIKQYQVDDGTYYNTERVTLELAEKLTLTIEYRSQK